MVAVVRPDRHVQGGQRDCGRGPVEGARLAPKYGTGDVKPRTRVPQPTEKKRARIGVDAVVTGCATKLKRGEKTLPMLIKACLKPTCPQYSLK